MAYGLAKLANLDASTAIGLLSTGCAPGGGASNMYTAMYGGDVDLSASMTFSSTILAFGLFFLFLKFKLVRYVIRCFKGAFPLWILLLGREFIDAHKMHFPYVKFLLNEMKSFSFD